MTRLCFALYGVLLLLACKTTVNNQSGKIAAGGYRVFYEQTGMGSPVLLIHAGQQNHQMWAEQVSALSKSHRVITLDLPFHGQTTGLDTAFFAKDVILAVMDSLKIQTAAIVGLSMGAAVTQDVAIHHPERISKVVLMSSSLYGYEDSHPIDSISSSWYPAFSKALTSGDTAGAAMAFARAWGDGLAAKGDSLVKPASRSVYQTTLQNLRQHGLKGWPNLVDSPKAYAGIGQLRMPVLILHGDQDLPFIGATSRYLEKTIPGAKRIELKGASHMINLEQPVAVNRLLVEFLKD